MLLKMSVDNFNPTHQVKGKNNCQAQAIITTR